MGWGFNLTLEDITIPEFCPILGIKLEKGYGTNRDNSPSLDRFDPSKGYLKGNVYVVSWRANALKRDGTLEEFKKLIHWMESGQRDKI
jgi:hypothetical protein